MNKFLLPAFIVFTFQCSYAQTPTWGSGIACLLYTHCTPCHHDNGVAPFSLTTYADAYSHMAVIHSDVNNHIMPPYPAMCVKLRGQKGDIND
jgi:hypothetical protein